MSTRHRSLTTGLILAAGEGRRFGAGVKQLVPLAGKPLLQHVVDTACAALDRVVLVLGAHADEIEVTLHLRRVEIVIAPDWASGQSASLKAGLAIVEGPVVILLGDQPGMTKAAIDAVLAARDPTRPATRAAYDGVPGHPVLIEPALARRAAELQGDQGFGRLLGDAALVECGGLADPTDVDTPAALARVLARRAVEGH